ncbi:MAG TPA: group II intron reverse transcriptase/maturase [Pseudonocardiaceae bacterium]|nr:group II intron reverse transcriptase/maturase [Pseudonocardiaceae bacterium]
MPTDVIKAKCASYRKLGKPEAQTRLVNEDDRAIVETYGAQYRGLVNYYLLAGDVWRLNRVHWVIQTSLLKTLAGKYDSTVSRKAARYKTTIDTPHGPRKCLQTPAARTPASVQSPPGHLPLHQSDLGTISGIGSRSEDLPHRNRSLLSQYPPARRPGDPGSQLSRGHRPAHDGSRGAHRRQHPCPSSLPDQAGQSHDGHRRPDPRRRHRTRGPGRRWHSPLPRVTDLVCTDSP